MKALGPNKLSIILQQTLSNTIKQLKKKKKKNCDCYILESGYKETVKLKLKDEEKNPTEIKRERFKNITCPEKVALFYNWKLIFLK